MAMLLGMARCSLILASRECSCRANRVLSCPESIADVLLGVLQEVVNSMQGISAAVQHLLGLLLYRPNALRCLGAHPARLLLFASPTPFWNGDQEGGGSARRARPPDCRMLTGSTSSGGTRPRGAPVGPTAHLIGAPSDGPATADELEHDDNDGDYQE
jgi:hypothetical protein